MEFPLYRKQVPYLKRPTPQVLCSTWTSKKSSFREGQGLMIHSFGRRRASTLRRAPVNIESQKNGTQSPTPAPTPGSSFGGLQLRPPTSLPTPEAFGKNLGDKPRVRLAWRGETPGETGRVVSRDAERRGKKPDARDARARSSEGDRGPGTEPPAGEGGPRGSRTREGRVSGPPPAAHPVPCVPSAASYLAAPRSRIGDPKPRGSRQPRPPLAPPPPAPPCRGARGRGSARGRRRGAGPEGRSAAPRPP